MSLTAVLWIGTDQLMAEGKADNGSPFAALLIWIFVVLPAPFIGNWITSLVTPRGHR